MCYRRSFTSLTGPSGTQKAYRFMSGVQYLVFAIQTKTRNQGTVYVISVEQQRTARHKWLLSFSITLQFVRGIFGSCGCGQQNIIYIYIYIYYILLATTTAAKNASYKLKCYRETQQPFVSRRSLLLYRYYINSSLISSLCLYCEH